MWNILVDSIAQAYQHVCLKKAGIPRTNSCTPKSASYPRSNGFNNVFLLLPTYNIYNLDIDLDVRRAFSRQQSNP